MDVSAGRKFTPWFYQKSRVFGYIPIAGVNRFRETEIKRQLLDDLPFEADISPAAKTIDGGNGESVEDIMLIAVDAVVPFSGIEAFKSEFETEGSMVYGVRRQIEGEILIERETIRDRRRRIGDSRLGRRGEIGFGGSAEG